MSGKYTPPGIDVKQAGSVVKRGAEAVNFVSGATVADPGGVQADVTVSGGGGGSALTVKDNGSSIDTAAVALNFAGTGVKSANTGTGADTITITGFMPPDVLSNRPAAASTNRGGAFYATDTKALYVSDGSSWTQVVLPTGDNLGFTSVLPKVFANSPVTGAVGQYILCDTSSGAITVNVPTAPADGSIFGVSLVKGANTVTYQLGGSDVLDVAGGTTSGTLQVLRQFVVLQYKASGAIWAKIASIPLSQFDTRYALAGAVPALPVSIANGGTGAATQQAALDAIAGGTTASRVLAGDGTHVTLRAVAQTDLPSTDPITTGKLICAGHSYGQEPVSVVGAGFAGGFSLQNGSFHDRGMWPSIVEDLFGPGADRKFYYITIPPLGATADITLPVLMQEDSVLMGAAYIPGGAITSGATNFRKWTVEMPPTQFAVPGAVVAYTDSSLGLSASTEAILCRPTNAGAPFTGVNAQAYMSAASTYTANVPVCAGGQVVNVKSTHVGTGKAEPGGIVILAMGGRFRNICVSGSQLQLSGVYQGGWATALHPRWSLRGALPHFQALPIILGSDFHSTQTTGSGTVSTVGSTINVASTTGFAVSGTFSLFTNAGAFTVTYTGSSPTTFTGCTIASGSQTYASGAQACETVMAIQPLAATAIGGTITLTGGTAVALAAIAAATSGTLTVAAIASGNHGTGLSNTQGHFIVAGQNPDNITATQVAILLSGVNDATGSFDIVAIRECLRAFAAFESCGAFYESLAAANVTTVPGTATSTSINATPGQFGAPFVLFSGSIATPPSWSISLGPAFDGSVIDLFFLAWAGASRGGAASIKIDGADPPQGAVTVSTSGASPTAGLTTITGTVANGSPTFTGTGSTAFTINDIGKLIVGTNVPAGTYISAVAVGGATTCTMSANATGANTGSYTTVGMVPVVKRITGVAAGAHTVTITMTAIDATNGTAQFMFGGYGFEPNGTSDLPAGVVLCKAPKIPSGSVGTNNNIGTYNTAIDQVIAGTAALISGNSAEPALPSSVMAVDLDAALNKNSIYFAPDGLHPNTQGQIIMGSVISTMIRQKLSQQQTIAR